jgi:hypothetical protein
MERKTFLPLLLSVLVLTALPARNWLAAAEKEDNRTSALINEALDKNVNLQLDGVLPDVLKAIEDKTGVRIEAADPTYDLLPWGEQTNIKAKIENQTLRAALTAITQKLGLRWDLDQFQISLHPVDALARLGRRATVAELQALDLLRTTPLGEHKEQVTVQELADLVDQKLATIKSPALVVELRAGDPTDPQAGFIKLDEPIRIRRETTIAGALQDMTRQTNATWYPWGKDIIIVPKEQQIRLMLDRTITARFNGQDISKVINSLSRLSGVPIQVEPGAYQRVPVEYRTINIDSDNATIRKVLEDIRGYTGLDYVVRADGIYMWNQNSNPTGLSAHGPTDPVVMTIDAEGHIQLFVRESEIPTDIRPLLADKKSKAFERIRELMRQENLVPTTQPTTQAAVQDDPPR